MKSRMIFWGALTLLFLTIVALICKNGWTKYVESMRVVPRPTVAPQVQYTPPPAAVVAVSRSVGGLNEDVDALIGQYFDKNLVPYRDTIALYYEYFVDKGNLNPELKKKLKDICYYIIEVVIPNIPSIDNPTPEIEWTRIEWLSNNWNAYNYSFNFDALANFGLLSKLRSEYGGDSGKSGAAGTEGTTGNGGSGDSASADGLNLTPPSSETSNAGGGNSGNRRQSGCNSACPTACDISENTSTSANGAGSSPLAQAATKANTPDWLSNMKDKQFNNKRNKDGTMGSDGLPGTSGQGTFTKTVGINGDNIIYEVLVTKAPNAFPQSQILNNYVKTQIIDKWFDTVENANSPLPSKYAQSMFDLYTNGRSPIDRSHKNKLRDFVYYYMENIIPGLPSADKPVSYVEWRPLRLLANSDL